MKYRSPLMLFVFLFFCFSADAQTTAFTYQGRLTDAAGLATGSYQMQFSLFGSTAANDQIGSTLTYDGNGGNPAAVDVAGGIFTVTLDFGVSPFTGADRFLEIRVKKPAESVYTTLNPRQQITSSPYSIRTLSAVTADNATALENRLNTVGTLNSAANPVQWTQLKNVPTELAGFSSNGFIQNNTLLQSGANFNISGSGTLLGTLKVGAATLPQTYPTGIYGTSTGNNANGIWGRGSGNSAAGVYGEGVSANSFGLYGIADIANGAGVFGSSNNASSNGVYGYNQTSGNGVFGFSLSGVGILGQTTAISSPGIRAFNQHPSGTGLLALGNNLTAPTVLNGGSGLAAYGTVVGAYAVGTNTANGVGLAAGGNNITGFSLPAAGAGILGQSNAYGVVGYSNGALANNTWAAYFDYLASGNGYIFMAGRSGGTDYGFVTSGVKSGMVNGPNGENRIIYAIEAPEIVLQDFGTGELKDGRAAIKIDPILAGAIAVNDKHPLRVFIQLEGDCNGVFVTNKTPEGFEVVELAGGRSNVKFTWQIVANRADSVDRTGTRFDADGQPLVSLMQDVRFPVGPARPPTQTVKPVTAPPAAPVGFPPPRNR